MNIVKKHKNCDAFRAYDRRKKRIKYDWDEELTTNEKSPCKTCIIRMTCKKTFSDGSACDKLGKFIDEMLKDIGAKIL